MKKNRNERAMSTIKGKMNTLIETAYRLGREDEYKQAKGIPAEDDSWKDRIFSEGFYEGYKQGLQAEPINPTPQDEEAEGAITQEEEQE